MQMVMMPARFLHMLTKMLSTKVIKLIQSYTGIVNKMVWRKQ